MYKKLSELEPEHVIHILMSAVDCLQDIASLKGTLKKHDVPADIAINWLQGHAFPLDRTGPGYVRGKGYR